MPGWLTRHALRWRYVVICVTLLLSAGSFPNRVQADPLVGGAVNFYHSFEGTPSAITVDFGNGPVSTGEISFTLDLTNPSAQVFTFNFDTLTATAEVDFIVDFPLLHDLGEAPLRIHISESGPITTGVPDLPPGNQSLSFTAMLSGGGTVGPGSIFAGTVFTNLNQHNVVIQNINVAPGGNFNQNINGGGNVSINANVTVPIGPQGPTTRPSSGGGTFTTGTQPTPEPATLFLLGTGLAGIAARSRKRWKARKNRR